MFDPDNTFATYSDATGTFYMHQSGGGTGTYALEVRQMPDPSVNLADCSPTASPATGVVSGKTIAFTVTYNCKAIGRARMYLGIRINGTCLSNAVW